MRETTKPFDTKTLLETSIDLSKARDMGSIAEILFDFIQDIVPIDMAVLYTLEEDGQSLRPRACRGAKIENLKKRKIFRLGQGGVGYVGREKKALLLTDVQRTTNLPIKIRQVTGEDPEIRSFLSVPLIVNNRLTGVLSASSSRPNRYTMHDVEIVSIVANQVAALVELYTQMEDTQKFSDHILENINSGVIVTDMVGNIIMINRMGEKIIGRRQPAVRGRSILRLKYIEADTRTVIRECLAGKKPLLEAPGVVLLPGGGSRHIRMSSSRLLTTTGAKKGFIIIFRDITNVEQLQQRLARFERLAALGRWTSSISHEIRNSLLPIRTSVQLLRKKLLRNEYKREELRELLEVLEEESERLNRYLNRLSDPNRSAEGRNFRTPLFTALEETVALVYPKIQERNILLQLPEKAPFYLPFSKDQIKEMFLNLFFNSIDALEATEEGREKYIRIDVRSEPDGATVIDFIDNGAGMKREDSVNIFEPFFTTKAKGTGLGLYNIYAMISEAGGTVQFESEVGKGTVVTLTLKSAGARA